MIIKSPDPRGTWVPRPLFQRGESTQKNLIRHYSMLGVPIKKPDAPFKIKLPRPEAAALFLAESKKCHSAPPIGVEDKLDAESRKNNRRLDSHFRGNDRKPA